MKQRVGKKIAGSSNYKFKRAASFPPLITLMNRHPERSDSEVKDLMDHSQTENGLLRLS
jgi:hypothetical protein